MQTQIIGGVRGSKRKPKPRAKKTAKTNRRKREDVRIRWVDPDGRAIDEGNLTTMARTLLHDEDRTFTELAEETGKAPGTISRLYYGDTQRVSLGTAAAVFREKGYQIKAVKVPRS